LRSKGRWKRGYGVELDVQLTKDKVVVVFHDDDLKRACGVDARVDAYTFEELQAFPLFGTAHRIPTFTDVLGVLDGRIPVIVELKSAGDWKRLCPLTLELLEGCKGDYCVESFHPLLVRWFLHKRAADSARAAFGSVPLLKEVCALVSVVSDEPPAHQRDRASPVRRVPYRAEVPLRPRLRSAGRDEGRLDGARDGRPQKTRETERRDHLRALPAGTAILSRDCF
jgi:hypothetical protein